MYRIWLHAVPERGIDNGWWGGHGRSRINSVIYDRTDKMEDAFDLDGYNAVQFYVEFKKLGWSCEIIPKISNEKMLELLIQ